MDTHFIQAFIDNFRKSLLQGANYDEVANVDQVDKWYDDAYEDLLGSTYEEIFDPTKPELFSDIKFNQLRRGDGRFVARTTAENYVKNSDAPEYLLDIFGGDEEGKSRVEEEAQSAYAVLSITDSPEQVATVLGGYYGIDFSPIAQNLNEQSFGGFNLAREGREKDLRGHTDSSIAQINEFHSFIEPILQDQIPFLMMTRGLNYQDALQATFTEDPMIQALYGKYGVSPIRLSEKQRDEGRSTYLYDPFSFGEIRTFRARDDELKVVKIVASIAAAYYAPQLLLKATGVEPAIAAKAATATTAATPAAYSTAQIAAATAATSAGTTLLSGGDFKDALKSAGLAFVGSTVAQQLGNAKAAATPGTAEHTAAINAGSTAAQLADNYTKAKVIYAATQISSGIATGSVAAGFLAAFGPDLTAVALDKVGLTSEVLGRAGVDQKLLVDGLVRTQTALARGMELDEALATGLGAYILAGGGIAGVNKDTFFEKMGEVLRDTSQSLFGTKGPDLSNADASLNTLYADDYVFETPDESSLSGLFQGADKLTEDMLTTGGALWVRQPDGSYKDNYSGVVLDPSRGDSRDLALALKLSGANFDMSEAQILNELDALSGYFDKTVLSDIKDATVPEIPPNFLLAAIASGRSFQDLLTDFDAGKTVADIEATFDPRLTNLNIGLGVNYSNPVGVSQAQNSFLVGKAIDQIAQAMHEEDRNSGGDSTSPDDFRGDAAEAYKELREAGYSHVRVMEELGVDTSGRVLDAVRALDSAALNDLRASDEREAYLRTLGSVDETTGRDHERSLYESGIEQPFIYDIAKRALEAAEETGDDKWVLGTAIAIEAGVDVANAFLGLVALGGIDPESTELGKTLKAITDMTGESKPEDYQKGLEDINQRLQAAQDQAEEEGLGTSDSWMLVGKAIMGAAAENPTEFILDFVVKETASEIIPFIVGGLAFGGAKLSAAVAKKFGDDAAKKFAENLDASDIAVATTMLSDAAEETGGAASSGYSESYDAKIKQLEEQNARLARLTGVDFIPLSDAQIKEAEEFATEVARKAGITGLVLSVVSDGALGGNQLARGLFGDRTTNAGTEFLESLINRVTRIGEGAGREFMLEGLQEGGVQAVIEGALYEIDPDRPMSASIAQNAILGSIIGGSVGGGIGTSAEVSDILANVVQKTAPTIRATIEGAKNGLINDAEARAALAQFGITSDEYGALQTSLMNEAFDADYTSYTESRDAFQATNPDYAPTEADILQFTGNFAENRLSESVADLVDRSYIDAQEAIDAAALEGLTLTQEQAAQYVRQTESGQAQAALDRLRSDVFDPLYVTRQEATDYFTNIGYTPTEADLAAFVGKTEAQAEASDGGVTDYSVNMLMLQLDGLIRDNTSGQNDEQIKNLTDRINVLDPDRLDPSNTDDTQPPKTTTLTPGTFVDPDGDGIYQLVEDDGSLSGEYNADGSQYVDPTKTTPPANTGDDISGVKTDLLNRIDAAERAGIDRDTALGDSISDLARELGVTENTLLRQIGATEESLRTEINLAKFELTTEINAVGELVGKPASEVTDADIDFVADLIAQQETLAEGAVFDFTQEQLAYDVTGDQVVDQADLDLLQQATAGQDVTFDLQSKFAPTGVYATQQEMQQELEQQQQQLAQQTQQQIKTEATKDAARDFFGELLGAADLTGQKVDVAESPLAKIDYLYDFGSIFGTPQQGALFPTPYGNIGGRKQGGLIERNKELLRVIGED